MNSAQHSALSQFGRVHNAHTLCILSRALGAHAARCVARHDALSCARCASCARLIATLLNPISTPAWPCHDPKAQVATPDNHLCRDIKFCVTTPQQPPLSRHQYLCRDKVRYPHKAPWSRNKNSGRDLKTSPKQHLFRDIKICVATQKNPNCLWPCRDIKVHVATQVPQSEA